MTTLSGFDIPTPQSIEGIVANRQGALAIALRLQGELNQIQLAIARLPSDSINQGGYVNRLRQNAATLKPDIAILNQNYVLNVI